MALEVDALKTHARAELLTWDVDAQMTHSTFSSGSKFQMSRIGDSKAAQVRPGSGMPRWSMRELSESAATALVVDAPLIRAGADSMPLVLIYLKIASGC